MRTSISPAGSTGIARAASKIWSSIGPSIVVASIVLGPGSVLMSSKVGCQYGYAMLWLLAFAALLMMAMTALGAYLGAINSKTPCQLLAERLGRPASIALGSLVFAIIACFQSSNNAAVLASVEGLLANSNEMAETSPTAKIATLIVLNGLIIATMYGFTNLYRPLERLMIALVLAMLVAFGVNFIFAGPSITGLLAGFVPNIPMDNSQPIPVWVLLGLVATTYSVAGAFYQCYLVREKGWKEDDVAKGLVDSFAGIALLGFVSALIMSTSAAALHGKVPVEKLTSVAAIAKQLEPFFGAWATLLFSLGIFAAAFSSFFGNALVGGTVFSDGLGLGSSIDQKWPKRLTVLALVVGMTIACTTTLTGGNEVEVIVFAQALTVLGVPMLAMLMLWLGFQANRERVRVPRWILMLGCVGGIITVFLAVRTLVQVWKAMSGT